MQTGELVDMERAWRDYFDPLEARFPEHAYHEQLDKYRQARESARAPHASEAQRFFQQGELLKQQGNLQGAAQVWGNLIAVFEHAEADKEWVRRAERALTDLEKAAANADRLPQMRPALERAAALEREGKHIEAERIWTALEALYRDDPAGADVRAEICRARKKP
jgi:tetratricopeptide (TPR) repeat protein